MARSWSGRNSLAVMAKKAGSRDSSQICGTDSGAAPSATRRAPGPTARQGIGRSEEVGCSGTVMAHAPVLGRRRVAGAVHQTVGASPTLT
jgi:hypothetical protein